MSMNVLHMMQTSVHSSVSTPKGVIYVNAVVGTDCLLMKGAVMVKRCYLVISTDLSYFGQLQPL